jgi:hypothetical protein
MDDFEVFLTDEFVEFSKRIAELHAIKKQKTEEFRAIHAQFKADITELDQAAKEVATGWELWKSKFGTPVKK